MKSEASNEATLNAAQQPAWQDELPSEELRALYEKLPQEITKRCENARQGMRKAHAVWRDAYTRALVAAHNALVAQPDGLDFKAWCKAAGINYRTAHGTVSRALATERKAAETAEAAEQATGMQMHTARSVLAADAEGSHVVAFEAPTPQPPAHKASAADQYRERSLVKLALKFHPDDRERVLGSLKRVMESRHYETREDALLYILDVFEERTPEEVAI